MKKDITFHKVEGIAIAIVKRVNEAGIPEWFVNFLNMNEFALDNVLIVSRGYGDIDNEKRATSTLRHMLPHVAGRSFEFIELIDSSVFRLTNEFWVSYYIGNQIFDKKFIFVPDTIIEENLTAIPFMEDKGILHE